MEKDTTLEHLAKDFHIFLRDEKTYGRSYIAKLLPPNTVRYEAAGYHIETEFTDKYQCNLTVTGPLNLEELISVPYESPKEPNWTSFFKGIFTLIKENLNKS
ncbi:MAG: hypothetical protein KJ592_04950 [Nanoarchaeota archaeon]|nr:hypothetical protein [Nanoarchaeota archaeon]